MEVLIGVVAFVFLIFVPAIAVAASVLAYAIDQHPQGFCGLMVDMLDD